MPRCEAAYNPPTAIPRPSHRYVDSKHATTLNISRLFEYASHMSEARLSDTDDVGDEDQNTIVSLATSTLIAVRTSFLWFVVTIGVVLLALSVLLSGYVMPSVFKAIISGMTFILGVSALLYAVLGKMLLRLLGYS